MFARPAAPDPSPRAIAVWLRLVAAMVFAMVVIGGITRLTESGLSITRWDPISGAIPPLDAADWQAQFDLYKASPQYAQMGHGMTLADFKFIFFWEYVHRLLGRLIGLAFALAAGLVLVAARDSRGLRLEARRRSSLSARCRARSAGGWSRPAWSTGPRSAISASPST